MTLVTITDRWVVRRYASVTSTMDVAARLIADGDVVGPTAVVADHQTAGRGRSDRVWRSVPGGSLQMTAILTLPVPPSGLGPVPLLVGNIVAESIEALDEHLKPRLKWPNDVLIDDRKVAGILVVSRSTGQSSSLQIGIGVNIVEPEAGAARSIGLSQLLTSDSTSPSPARVREVLLGEILARLDGLPGELARDGGADGLERWTRRATLLGQPVRVRDGDRTTEGVMLGVDRTGALRLRTATGEVATVVAGDLTRGPRPIVDDASPDHSEDIA